MILWLRDASIFDMSSLHELNGRSLDLMDADTTINIVEEIVFLILNEIYIMCPFVLFFSFKKPQI